MSDSNVAKSYAKAVIELSEQLNVDISVDMIKLTELINSSNDLENVLFLDIFTLEEKRNIVNDIFSKVDLSKIFKNFFHYLLEEKRLALFPLIFKELMVLDDFKKGFIRGEIRGYSEKMDKVIEERIKNYLKKEFQFESQLEYKYDPKISAGYKITVDDLQLDATVENQLNQLKKQVLKL